MEIIGEFSTSVRRALEEMDEDYRRLPGLVVCGTHAPENVEEQIEKIRQAREGGYPYLGVCFGHQLAAIEYARNVLGVKDATSEEVGEGTLIVKRRPTLKVGLHEGESWWSNYEVDPLFERNWEKPDNFVTTPFHPEYESRKGKPHPVLVQFLKLCKAYKIYAN